MDKIRPKTETFSETLKPKSRIYRKSFIPPTEYSTVAGESLILRLALT